MQALLDIRVADMPLELSPEFLDTHLSHLPALSEQFAKTRRMTTRSGSTCVGPRVRHTSIWGVRIVIRDAMFLLLAATLNMYLPVW